MVFHAYHFISENLVDKMFISDDYNDKEIAEDKHIIHFEKDKEQFSCKGVLKVYDETERLVAVL